MCIDFYRHTQIKFRFSILLAVEQIARFLEFIERLFCVKSGWRCTGLDIEVMSLLSFRSNPDCMSGIYQPYTPTVAQSQSQTNLYSQTHMLLLITRRICYDCLVSASWRKTHTNSRQIPDIQTQGIRVTVMETRSLSKPRREIRHKQIRDQYVK